MVVVVEGALPPLARQTRRAARASPCLLHLILLLSLPLALALALAPPFSPALARPLACAWCAGNTHPAAHTHTPHTHHTPPPPPPLQRPPAATAKRRWFSALRHERRSAPATMANPARPARVEAEAEALARLEAEPGGGAGPCA